MSHLLNNAAALEKDFTWLSQVIELRFKHYFKGEDGSGEIFLIAPPVHPSAEAPYLQFLEEQQRHGRENEYDVISADEILFARRLIVLLALAPHLKPAILDVFFTKNSATNRGCTEFGGLAYEKYGGFLPTGETALFLLAGDDLKKRLQFSDFLTKEKAVYLDDQPPGAPVMSGRLCIYPEYLARFTTGDPPLIGTVLNLPIEELTTSLDWDDLAIDSLLRSYVRVLATWLEHESMIMEDWGMKTLLRPGYRAIFHGPPGTSKTLSATLIGKTVNKPVYRIDLSQLISKYIGETEKNLASLFKAAEALGWILFFDEADALFGKRTKVKDSQVRSANREVSAFLQNIENFGGMVILAVSDVSLIDKAFARRFQSILYFPVPDALQRQQIWESAFGDKVKLGKDINFRKIAKDYELTRSEIMNVAQYSLLKAAQRAAMGKNPDREIEERDLLNGIRQELTKFGKVIQ
jgi:AAA+ superfamily predicted ATPase